MAKKKLTLPQLMMAAVMAAILIASFAYSSRRNFPKGVYVGEQFFYLKSQTLLESTQKNQISFKQNDSSIDFTLVFDGNEESANLKLDGDHITITYENGLEIGGEWTGERIIDKESEMPLEAALDEVTIYSPGFENPSAQYSSISNALYLISQNKLTRRNSIFTMLLGIAFYFIGALEFLFPETYHFFLRGWRYERAKLSKEGEYMEKLGGIIVMVIGLIALTGIFIS